MHSKHKVPVRKANEIQVDKYKEADTVHSTNIIGKGSCKKSLLFNSILLVVLHVLDVCLLIVLLPFILWKWVTASDRTKIVLRAIVEVTLELVMWVIFAGVSVLMTAALALEDTYFRKNDSEKLKKLLISQNESALNNHDSGDIIREKEKPRIPNNEQ